MLSPAAKLRLAGDTPLDLYTWHPELFRGNPHVDVKEVLAIWRESVSPELRRQWFNIDPTEEDRILVDDPAADAAPTESPDRTPETAVDA